MMDLTLDEKRRLWEALLEYDPYAPSSPTRRIDDDLLYVDGYLHLDNLFKVAEVVEALKAARAHAAPPTSKSI